MTSMKYAPNEKTYELHQYVEPHPGKDNKDRIRWQESCGRCGGSGIYHWNSGYGHNQGQCFGCWGTGKVERSQAVQTQRKAERERALWAEYGDELRAFHSEVSRQNEIARLAEEFEQAWDGAHAEQQRRNALTQGFVAEVGEKVTNIKGTVKVATTYDASYGYRRATGMFLIVETESGHTIKIAGTGDSLFQGLDRGDEVVILSGTVKAHETYKGQDQTQLTRVKLDDFDKRAMRALAHGKTDVDEAIEYGHIKKAETKRFEEFVEAERVEYEKELVDA